MGRYAYIYKFRFPLFFMEYLLLFQLEDKQYYLIYNGNWQSLPAWAPHKPWTEQNFKKLSSLIIYKQCTFNGFRRVKLIKKKEKKRKKIDWFFMLGI